MRLSCACNTGGRTARCSAGCACAATIPHPLASQLPRENIAPFPGSAAAGLPAEQHAPTQVRPPGAWPLTLPPAVPLAALPPAASRCSRPLQLCSAHCAAASSAMKSASLRLRPHMLHSNWSVPCTH